MKQLFPKIILLAIFVSFFSCDNQNKNVEIELISVDIDKSQKIDLRDSVIVNMLSLEMTDSSLLEEIQSVELLDDKILVYNSNRVVAFNEKGEFIYDIYRKGQGPGEYARTTSFFVRNGKIFLFDDISQKLLSYDSNGNFLSVVNRGRENEISVLRPVNDSIFIAKNRYQGKNIKTLSFCLLNKQLNKLRDIENKTLKSGEIDFDHFYSYNDRVLYWEFLNDTIYTFSGNLIEPKYVVDFMDYSIPVEEKQGKENNQIIEYLQSTDNPKIATGIKYLHEDSHFLRFVFIQKESIVNLVKYNKLDKTTKVFQLFDSQYKLRPQLFMAFQNGKIIMAFHNLEEQNNPDLIFIDDEHLK